MPVSMKALRSGNLGPGGEKVRRGREFDATNDLRADELERAGLAYRVDVKLQPPVENKMIETPENKAASEGPLDLAGGRIGEGEPAPSSRRGRRRLARILGGSEEN